MLNPFCEIAGVGLTDRTKQFIPKRLQANAPRLSVKVSAPRVPNLIG